MTRVLSPEGSVSLEGLEPEPLWVMSDDFGHHYRGSQNGCKDADQSSRDDNEASRQPLLAAVLALDLHQQHPFLPNSYNMEFILLWEGMRKYQESPLREPRSSSFSYAAWRIDLVRVGPFVLNQASADG